MTTTTTKKISFLKNHTKEEFIQQIVPLIKNKCEQAFVFGSFFTDKFNTDSDFDLIVITETTVPFLERPLLYTELLDFKNSLNIPLDLLVYNSQEFQKLLEEGKSSKSGFWFEVSSTLKKIL
jgi:predicted nucleotidyltransferase